MNNAEAQLAARQRILAEFDPNTNGISHHGIFGLPFTPEEAQIVLLPVPWEVTVSYGEGTAEGPEAILEASQQIDLFDPIFPDGWKAGIAMAEADQKWIEANSAWRGQTVLYLHELGQGGELSPQARQSLHDINLLTEDLRQWVYEESRKLIKAGKFAAIVGGEHSVPLGYMQALAEEHGNYGILQIDAHADLRIAYEGFTHSHASIMYNATRIPQVERLVQVGIRDFSHQENQYAQESGGQVIMFTDHAIKKALYDGDNWKELAERIIALLPENVYVSFDIDGLQPWLCPGTGTPVAGGLQVEEAFYLLEKLVASGRRIIGFDLCEVAPSGDTEWDGNVGCRVLYKLCMLAAKSNNLVIGD